MSYLQAIFEYIQNICQEDEEFKKMCQEIEEINGENLKLERDIEEYDREYVRLQIEQHNLHSVTTDHNDEEKANENCNQTSTVIFKQTLGLKSLLKNIDFGKIVKCHHMEMETKFLKESQPIQEAMAKSQDWYDKMEQRHIVREYRQAESVNREAVEEAQKELDSMQISVKDSKEKLEEAMDKRNYLIVSLIQGGKEIRELNEKVFKLNKYEIYIKELRQKKLMLIKEQEEKQLKTFNPNLSSSTRSSFVSIYRKSTQSIEAPPPKLNMPNLPSLEEILQIFNQTKTKTICKKPILHDFSYGQRTVVKQNKNVSFKMPLEEFHEYPQQEMETELETKTESETETELQNEDLKQQIVHEINVEKEDNLPERIDLKIETIDLLTPTEKEAPKEKTVADNKQQPLIEIQECIVFKTPFPMQQVNTIQKKEINDLDTTASSSKQLENSSTFSSSNDKITSSIFKQSGNSLASVSSNVNFKDVLNTTKILLNNELTNISSSSAEVSSDTPNFSKKLYLKDDFEAFFKDNEEYFLASRETSETSKVVENNETADFLDFGPSKGFTFDSDDGMNENVHTLDFM